MSAKLFTRLQQDMKTLGVYGGAADGSWGPLSHAAFQAARDRAVKGDERFTPELLSYAKAVAWSAKVSPAFVTAAKGFCDKLGCPVDSLMSCMAFETGETFSPTIKNGAGAPYYGLIQFGAAAATDAGTSIELLLKMTAEQQLQYVYNFFKPYTGKLKDLSDVYMRILYPVAVGKPMDYVLFSESGKGKAYAQNRGLDVNRDGNITKGEAAAKVYQKLVEGLHPKNLRVS